jgi:WD40 repeat protein
MFASLEEVDLFPCAVQTAKFMKSKDRVAICGNQLNNLSQISITRHVDGVATMEACHTFSGTCNSLEVCEMRNGIVLGCAGNSANGVGTVVLCSVKSDQMGYSELSCISEGLECFPEVQSCTSGLAFDEYHCTLAQGKDDGSIILNDLTTGQIVSRFSCDSTGVVTLCYKHAATLVVSSQSAQNRLKIFDLRISKPEIISVIDSSFQGAESTDPVGGIYTAVKPHKLNETIACGTAAGDLLLWDMRNISAATAVRTNVHGDKVTSIQYHPLDSHNKLISASNDGNVLITSMVDPLQKLSSGLRSTKPNVFAPMNAAADAFVDSETIVSDAVGFTSLDYEINSNQLLIASKLGSVYKYHLSP